MIVGNGMLAKKFISYDLDVNIIIFASGVSNSNEILEEAFEREKKLLLNTLNTLGDKKIIYFSTCSVYDTYFKKSKYTEHKLEMEYLIEQMSSNYSIFRLPQVIGESNKSQLIRFLYEKIKNNQFFDLYDIERNIIDITDIKIIIDEVLRTDFMKNKIINIANPLNIKVIDLVSLIEKITENRAEYKLVKKLGQFKINIKDIKEIVENLQIFDDKYLENRIRKYYE